MYSQFLTKIAYNRLCILLLLPYVGTVKTDVNTIRHDSYIKMLPCVKNKSGRLFPEPQTSWSRNPLNAHYIITL